MRATITNGLPVSGLTGRGPSSWTATNQPDDQPSGTAPLRNKRMGTNRDENLQKFRLFQEGMVWEAYPRKFRNFGINLVHSGVYSGGFLVEMET